MHHGRGTGLLFLYSLDCLFNVIQALKLHLQHSWGLVEVMLCIEREFEGVFWRDTAENRGIRSTIFELMFKLRREGAWYLSPGTALISSHCKDLEAFSKLQKKPTLPVSKYNLEIVFNFLPKSKGFLRNIWQKHSQSVQFR